MKLWKLKLFWYSAIGIIFFNEKILLNNYTFLKVNPGARSFNIPIRVEGQEEATQTNVREATMQKTNSLRRGVSLQERSRVVVNGRQIDIQSNDTLEEEVGNDVNRGRTIQLNINL